MEAVSLYDILGGIFAMWETSFRTKRTYFSAFPRMTSFLKVSIKNTETNAIRESPWTVIALIFN